MRIKIYFTFYCSDRCPLKLLSIFTNGDSSAKLRCKAINIGNAESIVNLMTNSNFKTLTGIVKPGHQVASGNAPDSPYELGTLEMQLPFFRDLGLDLTGLFLGTLNVSIFPYRFKLIQPQYTFPHVQWHPQFAAETFSFSPCQVIYQAANYEGLIYYPHPETKIGHFQDDSIIEVIAPHIPSLNYGDRLELKLNYSEIELIDNQ